MKNFKIVTLLIVFVFCNLFVKGEDTIRQGDKITKQLELDFNDRAKKLNSFITWELTEDDWQHFDVEFNQGTFDEEENHFTIKAKDYKTLANSKKGIFITIKPKESLDEEGTYSLSMKVHEHSDNLAYENVNMLNLELNDIYFVPPPPTPLWLRLLYIFLAVFVVFHIIWFALLKKKIYPRMTGSIQFSDGAIVKLNNCYEFYLYTSPRKPSYAQSTLFTSVYCGKKGAYQMPYPEELRDDKKFIIIKPVKARKGFINKLQKINNIEFISTNKKLYHEEEYRFKDANADTVVSFVYDNVKHTI
ncbi:MAG: hypothetical protein ACOCWG_04315 [bacterium]